MCATEAHWLVMVLRSRLLLKSFLRVSLNENVFLLNFLSHFVLGSLYLGILGFKSGQLLARWISAYLIYGDQALCLFSLFASAVTVFI